jgi:hypothetical protein
MGRAISGAPGRCEGSRGGEGHDGNSGFSGGEIGCKRASPVFRREVGSRG